MAKTKQNLRDAARDALAKWFAEEMDKKAWEAMQPVVIRFEVTRNEDAQSRG
jgi:hypothetical protein